MIVEILIFQVLINFLLLRFFSLSTLRSSHISLGCRSVAGKFESRPYQFLVLVGLEITAIYRAICNTPDGVRQAEAGSSEVPSGVGSNHGSR
ncbi:hypothetical protein SCA6_000381 [Theobroma cacao]